MPIIELNPDTRIEVTVTPEVVQVVEVGIQGPTGPMPDMSNYPTKADLAAAHVTPGFSSILSITSNGDGSITVQANSASFYTDVNKTSLVDINLPQAVLVLVDLDTNFIVGDRDTASFVVLNDEALIDYSRYLPYAECFRSGTNVHQQISPLLSHGEVESHHQRISETDRYARAYGLDVLTIDVNRKMRLNSGRVWSNNIPFNIVASSASTRVFHCYKDGAGVYTSSSALDAALDNNQYNGPTGLVVMTPLYWKVVYIFRGIESPDHLYYVSSEAEYQTREEAKSSPLLTVWPELISSHAMMVFRVTIQVDQIPNLEDIEGAFVARFSGGTPVSSHSGLTELDFASSGHTGFAPAEQGIRWIVSTNPPDPASYDLWIKPI